MVVAMVEQAFDRLLQAYHSGSPLLLLLDYDGTLTPIVSHPSQARLPSRARWLLCCLARQSALAVGILSGRSLEDLKAMVGLSGLIYGGNSGLELEVEGKIFLHPEAEARRDLVNKVARELQALTTFFPRAWVEEKKLGLTLHFRQLAPELRPALLEQARELLQPYADQLRIVPAPMALEITPVPEWSKGSAVEWLLDRLDGETFPFYAGDSANDLEAIQVVADRGGLAVGVGPDVPTAQHTVPTPDALIDLLAGLLPAITVAGLK